MRERAGQGPGRLGGQATGGSSIVSVESHPDGFFVFFLFLLWYLYPCVFIVTLRWHYDKTEGELGN